RVQARRFHVLNHHGLQVFGMRQLGEQGIVRPRLPPVLGNELLANLLQDLPHLRRHGRGPVDGAPLVLLPLEALVPAAVLVFLAAAAGAGGVARQSFAGHPLALLGCSRAFTADLRSPSSGTRPASTPSSAAPGRTTRR